jgi:hypothetical protein
MSKELELARKLVTELEEKERKQKVKLSSLKPGETFKIGEHDFIVLDHENGITKVISKNFMKKNVVFDNDCRDYNKSNLRKVMEKEILPVIAKEVGASNLVIHTVNLTSVDMQKEFEPCECLVRPLTFDEVREYNDLLVNKELNDLWWTCTPWSTEERGWKYGITVVSPSGSIYGNDCDGSGGVRPFCILKSNIFVSNGE